MHGSNALVSLPFEWSVVLQFQNGRVSHKNANVPVYLNGSSSVLWKYWIWVPPTDLSVLLPHGYLLHDWWIPEFQENWECCWHHNNDTVPRSLLETVQRCDVEGSILEKNIVLFHPSKQTGTGKTYIIKERNISDTLRQYRIYILFYTNFEGASLEE